MRLVLYLGKGGVGKTTTAAATAVTAAARGVRTLVASSDAAHSLGDVLEQRLGPHPARVAPGLDALEVDPRTVMAQHWGSIRDYLVSIFRYSGIEEVVAEELALLPGAEEIATLIVVEEHSRSGKYELVVLDCAPTASTLRLLTLPEVARSGLHMLLRLQQALSTVVTPLARTVLSIPLPDSTVFRDIDRLLHRRLKELHARVHSPETSVRLVTTPERMVIDEARRAFTDLCLFEVPCDAIVMNRLLPAEASKEAFFRDWGRLQEERLDEVESAFTPLPVLRAPLQEEEVTGLERLRQHGAEIFAAHEPQDVLGESPRLRFARDDEGYSIEVPLPNAERDDLDVAKIDDELIIRTRVRRRAIKLPRRMAALDLATARFREDRLVVRFTAN